MIRTRTLITLRERLRGWARQIARDVHALYLAAGDPRVPWFAKTAAIAVAAYALSPIDLIPDVVPVLGYVDDLVIVPLGILLAVKLVPAGLMAEFRTAAAAVDGERGLGRWGATVVVMVWVAGLMGTAAHAFGGPCRDLVNQPSGISSADTDAAGNSHTPPAGSGFSTVFMASALLRYDTSTIGSSAISWTRPPRTATPSIWIVARTDRVRRVFTT